MIMDIQTLIEERKEIINTFKEELIRRLNLPYTPEDLHEDISLLGAGLGLDAQSDDADCFDGARLDLLLGIISGEVGVLYEQGRRLGRFGREHRR